MKHMSDKRTEDSVARVISRFEDWKPRIEQSFQESAEFRSLCEDYTVCANALEDWQTSKAATAAQRQQEYTDLLAELGEEIQDWLENYRK